MYRSDQCVPSAYPPTPTEQPPNRTACPPTTATVPIVMQRSTAQEESAVHGGNNTPRRPGQSRDDQGTRQHWAGLVGHKRALCASSAMRSCSRLAGMATAQTPANMSRSTAKMARRWTSLLDRNGHDAEAARGPTQPYLSRCVADELLRRRTRHKLCKTALGRNFINPRGKGRTGTARRCKQIRTE